MLNFYLHNICGQKYRRIILILKTNKYVIEEIILLQPSSQPKFTKIRGRSLDSGCCEENLEAVPFENPSNEEGYLAEIMFTHTHTNTYTHPHLHIGEIIHLFQHEKSLWIQFPDESL